MKTCVLLLGCLLATASFAQSTQTRREVWQWRDANGVTHFSDQPVPGATKMVIGVSQPPPVAAPAPVSAAAAARTAPTPAPVSYSSLEIWRPANGESFFGADAVVDVRLRSDPALAPGDRVLTYLDGKLLPGENVLEHSLSNLSRGVHSLTSVILDPQGNERIRSEPVVFHIKQPTVNPPRNVGPSLRPRPQPLPAPANAGPR